MSKWQQSQAGRPTKVITKLKFSLHTDDVCGVTDESMR